MEKLGNKLGELLLINHTFKTSSYKIVTKILVEIDLKEYILESINTMLHKITHKQVIY